MPSDRESRGVRCKGKDESSVSGEPKGESMKAATRGAAIGAALLFMISTQAMAGGSGGALYVRCGANSGLNSINAALKTLQYSGNRGPGTIYVSGACRENVVIQSFEHLTLSAVNGASVSDASGGSLDVISIQDSRHVYVNGFAIYAGSGPNANGIVCSLYSLCLLSGNVIQGAGNGGVAVYAVSDATFDGDTLQNNANAGLIVRSGSTVRQAADPARPLTARNNGQGINIGRDALAILFGRPHRQLRGSARLHNSTRQWT